jgi:hypothetical protein
MSTKRFRVLRTADPLYFPSVSGYPLLVQRRSCTYDGKNLYFFFLSFPLIYFTLESLKFVLGGRGVLE